jgi:hypothetical protein
MNFLTRALLSGTVVVLSVAFGVSFAEVTWSPPAALAGSEDEGFECTIEVRLYDPAELASVHFGLEARYTCSSPIPDVSMTKFYDPQDGWQTENFPGGFRGPATIATCVADFDHFECPPLLAELPTDTLEAEGPQGPLSELPSICVARVDCSDWPCVQTGPFIADVCGDADRSGAIQTTDALITLRAAVDLSSCALAQCDADRSGGLSAVDALRVLRAAVGIEGGLLCPAPC